MQVCLCGEKRFHWKDFHKTYRRLTSHLRADLESLLEFSKFLFQKNKSQYNDPMTFQSRISKRTVTNLIKFSTRIYTLSYLKQFAHILFSNINCNLTPADSTLACPTLTRQRQTKCTVWNAAVLFYNCMFLFDIVSYQGQISVLPVKSIICLFFLQESKSGIKQLPSLETTSFKIEFQWQLWRIQVGGNIEWFTSS